MPTLMNIALGDGVTTQYRLPNNADIDHLYRTVPVMYGNGITVLTNPIPMYYMNKLSLYKNQALLVETTDYTIDRTTGIATMLVAPIPGDIIGYLNSPFFYRTDWQGTYALSPNPRTNKALNSENFTAANWVTYLATRTTGVSDPRGGTTAVTYNATATGGGFYMSLATAQALHTTSIWLRRRSGTGLVYFYPPVGSGSANVNPTSQWTRFTFTGNSDPTYLWMQLEIKTVGDEFDVAFAQAESGPVATSYIPTVASPVTVTDYTISSGLVTLADPLPGRNNGLEASILSWDGTTLDRN